MSTTIFVNFPIDFRKCPVYKERMTTEKTIAEQIAERGGATLVGEKMDLDESTIRYWGRENKIPKWHRSRFERLKIVNGVETI